MKPSTREWIKNSESDWQAALTLSRKRKLTFHDEACFHCQQSPEKYIKARLEEADIRFLKTHDLYQLLQNVLPAEPLWSALLPALLRLNRYAVRQRSHREKRKGLHQGCQSRAQGSAALAWPQGLNRRPPG